MDVCVRVYVDILIPTYKRGVIMDQKEFQSRLETLAAEAGISTEEDVRTGASILYTLLGTMQIGDMTQISMIMGEFAETQLCKIQGHKMPKQKITKH